MTSHTAAEIISRFYRRITGSTVEYDITSYRETVSRIHEQARRSAGFTDTQITSAARDMRSRIGNGQQPDSCLVEMFGLVFEAVRRTIRVTPFDCQLVAAIAMNRGRLAQMQTGEGKTLAAVFPAALNALGGDGVHVLTFNDYLARRDAAWMGPVYRMLDLNADCVEEGMTAPARRAAYRADITYLTARESGFDYLRDTLCHRREDQVHRPFHLAIVDEADSILIDESRVPLVIAGTDERYAAHVNATTEAVAGLVAGCDFSFDEYRRNVFLTEAGIDRLEHVFGSGNLYLDHNNELLCCIQYALHARHLLRRDRDYIVRNGAVELVDEFTGRVADRRRWPDGLQAAVEAKEGCAIQSKGRILNSIPLQSFIRQYPNLTGMTATARQAELELRECYGLHITLVPPNRPSVRIDHTDMLFPTKSAKIDALLDEIIGAHATGRPVLVGTQTIGESAKLAEELQRRGVACEVLNAKQDEYEAGVVAQAGMPGAVTISTNMAGRGTDIRLGGADERERERVVKPGGLYVIGTARYESRRIDNQLRGRAARQGDPGSSRFFLSLEDELFTRYRLADLLPRKFCPNTAQAIIDPRVMAEVNRVQRIVEGQNTEIKMTLGKYAALLEQQREIVFERRETLLDTDSAFQLCVEQCSGTARLLVEILGTAQAHTICRRVVLSHLDSCWSDYLAAIADIRDSIHLRHFSAQDPLFEFGKLALELFDRLLPAAEQGAIDSFGNITVHDGTVDLENALPKAPSATWTYLVSDDPAEHSFALQLGASVGLSAWAALLWPLTVSVYLVKRAAKWWHGRRRHTGASRIGE